MKPHLMPRHVGWIEVVTGCMFSGKTEELIKRLRRAQYARQAVVVFKPRIDARYAEDSVGSHSGQRMRSDGCLAYSTVLRFHQTTRMAVHSTKQFARHEWLHLDRSG